MSQIVLSTKTLYNEFMTKNDRGQFEFVENRVAIEKYQLSHSKIEFIKKYLLLINESNIVSDTTKMYFQSVYDGGMKTVFDQIIEYENSNGSKKLNINTCLSKLRYDSKKLTKYFPDDMISKLKNKNTKNIVHYQHKLSEAIVFYRRDNDMAKEICLKIPADNVTESISDEAFEEMLILIRPYTKNYMNKLIEIIPKEYIGYLNYLLYVGDENYTTQQRMETLKTMLSADYSVDELLKKSADKPSTPKTKEFDKFNIIKPEDIKAAQRKQVEDNPKELKKTFIQF